jgi:hypothetical protein
MMISPEIESTTLRFLGDDELCSQSEIRTVVELWGGDGVMADAILAEWDACGWIEYIPQAEPELPPLVHLTKAGYAAYERLQTPT